MGGKEIFQYLTHPAVDGKVSASTQNQAMNVIVFLYREVLKQQTDKFFWSEEIVNRC